MKNTIVEALAEKALKEIDMSSFVKEITPKLMKEMERAILAEASEIDWHNFLYDICQDDGVQNEIKRMMLRGLKGKF